MHYLARYLVLYFYPRPPRGGRPADSSPAGAAAAFLSTPSARRATEYGNNTAELADISIHALREEGDFDGQRTNQTRREFLSTPSARRATHTARR